MQAAAAAFSRALTPDSPLHSSDTSVDTLRYYFRYVRYLYYWETASTVSLANIRHLTQLQVFFLR